MADQKVVTVAVPVSKRGFATDFFLAGIATSGACVVSNPMEVVKTRMQLQGELAKTAVAGNAVPTVRYRNFAHGFYTICRTEGLVGIQRGLLPGMAYQVSETFVFMCVCETAIFIEVCVCVGRRSSLVDRACTDVPECATTGAV